MASLHSTLGAGLAKDVVIILFVSVVVGPNPTARAFATVVNLFPITHLRTHYVFCRNLSGLVVSRWPV